MDIGFNLVEILVAGIAAMAIGFFWYGPALFGKQWMELKGIKAKDMEKAKKEMGPYYGLSFLGSLFTAFILSHVMFLSQNFFGLSTFTTGMNTALWMWLGFVMPVQLSATIYGEKKWKLFAIDTFYQLAALFAMAIVITLL